MTHAFIFTIRKHITRFEMMFVILFFFSFRFCKCKDVISIDRETFHSFERSDQYYKAKLNLSCFVQEKIYRSFSKLAIFET
ncbi:hypothetical protein V8B55DRAFT_1552026 [Mucor lusitanicus]